MEQEIDLKKVRITDEFWASRQKLITEVVIPYQEKILNDAIPGVEKSHAIANFRIAAGQETGEFYGMVFQDSDLAKWLEGVAYSLAIHPDAALEKRADQVIDTIAKAQQSDGYLDTYFILKEPEHKFQNLQECHELYCAGHMMEAAVAYYEATGKKTLLGVCERLADCIDRHIGPEEGKKHGIPGHEEVELGLLRMYEVTGNERDRKLADYFVEQRGRDPQFFENEKKERGWIHWSGNFVDPSYYQQHLPVREQTVAKGHAVRCMYFFSAAAELARLTGDASLAKACDVMFDNVTRKQMHITGGIGQTAKWEGFTHDYDLPNDTDYDETCAAIGLVFFAHRMLKLRASGRYGDIMERALYNGVLSGMQLDGKRFFYVNPLEVNPGVSGVLPGYEHVLPQRPQWYACACCPPNVTRTVASLAKYAWDETDGISSGCGHTSAAASVAADGNAHCAASAGAGNCTAPVKGPVVYNHLFVGGEAEFTHGTIHTETGYPWNGRMTYEFHDCDGSRWTLALRIPSYAEDPSVLLNGRAVPGFPVKTMAESVQQPESESGEMAEAAPQSAPAFLSGDSLLSDGYLYLTRDWKEGDRVELSFAMPVRRVWCNPRVRADEGCVALMRGPLVYCFEGVDNGDDIQELRIPRDAELCTTEISEGPLAGMTAIDFEGRRMHFAGTAAGAPGDIARSAEEAEDGEEPLYSDNPPEMAKAPMRAVPYFAWGNRGLNQMRVWVVEY